jgi:hypothetical protein
MKLDKISNECNDKDNTIDIKRTFTSDIIID